MRYVYKKKIYRILFFILDAVGAAVFAPFKFFRRETSRKADRILVVRTDHVGDVIFATAVFAPLRRAFPASEIDLMAPGWAMGVLKGNPHISNIIRFDPPWFDRNSSGLKAGIRGFFELVSMLKKGRYDVFIDLRGDARHIMAAFLAGIKRRISYGITGCGFLLTDMVPYGDVMHEARRNTALLGPLGIDGDSSCVELHFSEEDISKVSRIKKDAGVEKPYAVVHIVPGHPSKDWSLFSFIRVLRYLKEKKGLMPVMIGSGKDRLRVKDAVLNSGLDAVDLSGKTTLSELGPLCAGASIFVGLDSGPSHIAAYTGTPTIMIFSGINDPAQWAPRGDNVRVVYPGKGKDLSAVSPDEVMREIDEGLRGKEVRAKG